MFGCKNILSHHNVIWTVGHDFANPPTVNTERSQVPARNRLVNACFETGAPEPWILKRGARLLYSGNTRSQWTVDGPGRMGSYSVELPADGASVQQTVLGLPAGERWTAIAHCKVPVGGTVRAALLSLDGKTLADREYTCTREPPEGQAWQPVIFDSAVPEPTAVLVVTHAGGEGPIHVDDLGLAPARRAD